MYKQHNQYQALRYSSYDIQYRYWWPTNLQGAYIQVYETCHLKCDNNNYHWYTIGTIDGNVTYVYDTYTY